VGQLESAEADMDSLAAVIAGKTEALSAAVKRGRELSRAQKDVAKALNAPSKEDSNPGRALALLREEVYIYVYVYVYIYM